MLGIAVLDATLEARLPRSIVFGWWHAIRVFGVWLVAACALSGATLIFSSTASEHTSRKSDVSASIIERFNYTGANSSPQTLSKVNKLASDDRSALEPPSSLKERQPDTHQAAVVPTFSPAAHSRISYPDIAEAISSETGKADKSVTTSTVAPHQSTSVSNALQKNSVASVHAESNPGNQEKSREIEKASDYAQAIAQPKLPTVKTVPAQIATQSQQQVFEVETPNDGNKVLEVNPASVDIALPSVHPMRGRRMGLGVIKQRNASNTVRKGAVRFSSNPQAISDKTASGSSADEAEKAPDWALSAFGRDL